VAFFDQMEKFLPQGIGNSAQFPGIPRIRFGLADFRPLLFWRTLCKGTASGTMQFPLGKPMQILLVDDEDGFLGVMGDVLHDAGHSVNIARDGKAARELLEEEKVDVVISDVFMPTLDGVRFHSYVREFSHHPDVPFIFISGFDDERTRSLVMDPAKDYFFSKTTPVDTILQLLDTLDKSARMQSR
jgi:CheY-like chemotaxis protein